MCHSTRAVEHFYLREDLTRTGTIAADIIELCADVGSKKNSSETMPAVPEEVQTIAASAQSSLPTSSVANAHHRKASDKDDRDSDEPQNVRSLETKPQVRALTEKEKAAILELFRPLIDSE